MHLLRAPAGPVESPRRAAILARACARIDASLETGISLDELAAEAGYSRFHFAHAFREAMGVPPHRYLTMRRVERAKELLRHTELPLTEIALSSGFSNQSHFTLRFREAVGTTPRAFRVDC